jgi:ribosomal-protein-alanine N-acetyltransferase
VKSVDRGERAGVAIGPAGPGDLDALAALHRRCFDEAWARSDFARILEAPSSFALIARGPPAAAGFVLARTVVDECEILTLAVAPAYRRHGVGRALLHTAIALASLRGARAVFLEVAADNEAARALYTAAGFRMVGVREGYYRRGARRVDGLTLKRAIDAPKDEMS